jgi:Arc/MetJ-type ribon-helix-helix transcriptional regulator
MSEAKMTVTLPPRLAQQAEEQVQAGWFSDVNSLVLEALRRYLETHQAELSEHFLLQDVQWALRGND